MCLCKLTLEKVDPEPSDSNWITWALRSKIWSISSSQNLSHTQTTATAEEVNRQYGFNREHYLINIHTNLQSPSCHKNTLSSSLHCQIGMYIHRDRVRWYHRYTGTQLEDVINVRPCPNNNLYTSPPYAYTHSSSQEYLQQHQLYQEQIMNIDVCHITAHTSDAQERVYLKTN